MQGVISGQGAIIQFKQRSVAIIERSDLRTEFRRHASGSAF